MSVEIDESRKLARYLGSIPSGPQGEGAIEAVAEMISTFCDDPSDAKWLVMEACTTWHEWRGPAGLKELLYSRRYPERPPSNHVQDYGPRPAVACDICHDWGYFTDLADPQKITRWCGCETGVWQRERHPGLVDALNSSKLTPSPTPADPNRPLPIPSPTTNR